MRRRDNRNPQVSSHARVDDVRSIAMRMDRIGAHCATQGRDRRALAPIRPGGYHNPMRIDPGAAQGGEERVPGRRSGEDRRDVHLMTQAPQPSPQHLYHALEAAEFGGRDDVDDHHVPLDTVSSVTVAAPRPSPWRGGRGAVRVRVPSRMTTAAARPGWWVRLTCARPAPPPPPRPASAPASRSCGAPDCMDKISTSRSALSRIPAPSAFRQASLAAKRAANAWTRAAPLAQAITSPALKTRPANPSSADPRARANRVVSTTSSPIPRITPAPTAG